MVSCHRFHSNQVSNLNSWKISQDSVWRMINGQCLFIGEFFYRKLEILITISQFLSILLVMNHAVESDSEEEVG